MSDITKLPILTSASDGTYLLAVDHNVAKRLPFPGAGQLRGNVGYIGSLGYTGSRGAASTIPGYIGSKGYTGSTGYIGSSGSSTYRGYVGSQGIQGIPGPGNVIIASTLPTYTTASYAIEYFLGVKQDGSNQTPIISKVNPVIFNTTLGRVGVGTTATQGTLHLKSTTSTSIFLEVTNTATKHQIFSDPIGNLNIDIDTFDAAGGSNFYISQVGARKITIIPNGNVGIVTDRPADTLDVSGILRVSSNNVISKSYGRYYTRSDSKVYLELQRYAALTSTDENLLYGGIRIVADIDRPETGGIFSFDNSQVNPSGSQTWRQRMTIIENGNIGINVPRPNTLFTVNANLTTTNVVPYSTASIQMIGQDYFSNNFIMNAFGATANANVIGTTVAGGTATTPTATNTGTDLLVLAAGGRGTTRYLPALAKIKLVSSGSRNTVGTTSTLYTDSAAGTQMEFYTSELASISASLRLWISHNGRITIGGGTYSGYSDLNVRQANTIGRAGSLSLTGINQEGSSGAGTSYILMGNAQGAGTAGPVIIQSTNRQFQIGTGTSFTTSTGGTFFRNFTIDNNGSGDIYGNWQVCGGVDTTATISTVKTTFNLVDTTATTVNIAGAGNFVNIGNSTGTALIRNQNVLGVNATQYLWTGTATIVYFASSATEIDIGASTGLMTINNPTVAGINAIQTLFDTTATTMNFARTARFFNAGANTGIATIGNPTVQGTQATQYLWNTTATTVYFANSATVLNIGADTGVITVNNPTVVGINTTQNLFYTTATTMNFAGAATSLNMGSQIDGSIATISNPTVVGSRAEQWLWNTGATTVNAFGAATSINIGAGSGTLTIGNPTVVGTQATQNLYNTVATSLSIGGAATTLNLGNATGSTATLRPGTLVGSNTTQNLYDTVATTVNAFGAATSINIGADSGTTTIKTMLKLTYSGNSDSVLQIMGTDTKGGVGYHDFLHVQNTGGGTNTNKFFRLDSVGSLQIIDSVYSNTLLQLKDNGDLNIFGSNVTSNQTTVNLINTNATTVNAFGIASTINIGTGTGIVTIGNPTVVGTQATQNLWNTVATTVNAFGYANAIRIGSGSGTTTVTNQLVVSGGTSASASTATVNVQGLQVVSGGLGVTGDSKFNNNLSIAGVLWVNSDLNVGGKLIASNIIDTALTTGQLVYPDANKQLTGSTNLTFDGTTLTVNSATVSNNLVVNGTIKNATWGGQTITNSYLTSSTITVTTGTGLSGGGTVALGGSVTISVNTATLFVASAVSATTATNAGYAYSFNTGTLVATAVTANNVTGGYIKSITAGTGTTVSINTGVATISIGQAVNTSSAVTFAGITVYGDVTGSGSLTMSGNVTAYSDQRLKTNIETIKDALSKTLAMRGVTYDRIDNNTARIGVVAQEIQQVIPEVVITDSNGILSVDYGNIVGVLIEAVKEQQNTIDQLTADMALLKSKLGL